MIKAQPSIKTNSIILNGNEMINGESIIMSEGTYDFTSSLGQVLPGMKTFSHTYWLRPRLVTTITCDNC